MCSVNTPGSSTFHTAPYLTIVSTCFYYIQEAGKYPCNPEDSSSSWLSNMFPCWLVIAELSALEVRDAMVVLTYVSAIVLGFSNIWNTTYYILTLLCIR